MRIGIGIEEAHHQHQVHQHQQQQQQHPSLIRHTSSAASLMSQFQLEQSSVIKTAPPGGRQLDFPKNEPLDLAPLTTLQEYYPVNYTRVYEHPLQQLAGNPTNAFALSAAQTSSAINYYQFQQNAAATPVIAQDWSRGGVQTASIDPFAEYSRHAYALHQTHPQDNQSQQQAANDQQQQRYKVTDMPSPVDSGIGGDMSLIVNPKEEFFASDSLLERSTERALSHRDSPVIIPKLHNALGFQYVLEAPISTSIRKEDDRMTYVNKGQFYTVSLDYIPDPMKLLKNATVKSQLMIVFREDKTYEEEIKTWQFWHSRQHSAKQRILEIDSKNSVGLTNLEELAHNAVQFYWNPAEGGVKISIAVQCLSTDFSNQKGVKGLPLHVQIDTYDGENDKIPFHRGYCQIKVFCDKGANRKMLHENRRDEKRRMQGGGNLSGRKKSDGEFHEACDRSEFYHMKELDKPAALFNAPEEYDRTYLDPATLSYDLSDMEPMAKRPRPSERLFPVMLYVRKREEQIYMPLHVVPPNLGGLAQAIGNKFGIDAEKITGLYKRCAKGATVRIDDEMLRHYVNEDTFVLDVEPNPDDGSFSATLHEIQPNYQGQQ